MRIDIAVVQRGLCPSRQKAKELILSGCVSVNGRQVLKPSFEVSDNDTITLMGGEMKYASRAGYKLEHAAKVFDISFQDMVCADIGASTGGFTDLMLQGGAKKVYAVDVGHDQLAEKLRSDTRVKNIEGTNVKQLCQSFFDERIDIMTADLSFISLKTALPFMLSSLEKGAKLLLLVKPQFEAGRQAVGKGGIVKDKKAHVRAINEVCNAAVQGGCAVVGAAFSPIKGGDGNIEYLLYAVYDDTADTHIIDIENIVKNAFDTLKCI